MTVCQKAAVEGRINCACAATPSTISVVSDGLPINRLVSAATPRRILWVGLGLGVVYFGNSAAYFAGLETVPASLANFVTTVQGTLFSR